MTDLDLLTRERHAVAHLRDSMFRLLGRMEHQLSTDFDGMDPSGWLRDRVVDLKEALSAHEKARDEAGFRAAAALGRRPAAKGTGFPKRDGSHGVHIYRG